MYSNFPVIMIAKLSWIIHLVLLFLIYSQHVLIRHCNICNSLSLSITIIVIVSHVLHKAFIVQRVMIYYTCTTNNRSNLYHYDYVYCDTDVNDTGETCMPLWYRTGI